MSYEDPYGDMGGGRPANPRPQQQRSGSKPAGKPNLEGYTEVKVRMQEFYAAYPTGAIVTTKVKIIPIDEIDGAARVMVKAKAYRTPDDPHPGTGTSWMVVPGKTPYTNGSEVENCETSAWGRAIAAVGIAIDKGIASASEIRNARGEDGEPPSTSGAAQLAAAARDAAGTTETPDPAASGTEARPEAEEPAPVKEEASPVIAAAQAAADAGAAPAEILAAAAEAEVKEGVEIERDADGKVKSKKPAKTKAPTPDPEAKAADPLPDAEQGMTYDEFIAAIREKFIPNGQVQQVARELVEQGVLPAIGSVRDLTNEARLKLYYAAIIRKDDDAT